MNKDTVLLFTRFGLGQGPAELQILLAQKYLSLLLETGRLPGKLLFYTDGVRLACDGSPVLEQLTRLENLGVELVLCKTCLDTYQLTNHVKVGVVGGMGDIIETMQRAVQVISL
ncbi:MAG TPA: DsrE family protein [Anaerolineaceae bacterium]|nr:DsrE family protein [Anaerolineaceae bacterium]HPN51422.1 DsrE family protein [Anaerolineaceae bacterium]